MHPPIDLKYYVKYRTSVSFVSFHWGACNDWKMYIIEYEKIELSSNVDYVNYLYYHLSTIE